MQEEEYTFVTLDSDDSVFSDAVVVDVDGENDLSGIVMIDDDNSDDTIFLSDADVHDTFSTDIDGADLSFML